jgi:glyoxylase-like metal-dependent hydrolase (beta-lactamase superfamily II)
MRIIQDVYLVASGQIRLSHPSDCHVYLLDCGGELALVDAGVGLDTGRIIANIRDEGFDERRIKYLLLTHCHSDHAGGCKQLREISGCAIVCSEVEGRLLEHSSDEEIGLDIAKRSGLYPPDYVFQRVNPQRLVHHGEVIEIGPYRIQALIVPGHSQGSTCYLMEREGRRILFSGDTVFLGGTIGLGNWPGSSLDAYRQYIGRLSGLAVDALLPGHFLWTLEDGQKHLDKAVENLKLAWVPPAWEHHHAHR